RRLFVGDARSARRSEEIHLRARLGTIEALRRRERPVRESGSVASRTRSRPLVRAASAPVERRTKSWTALIGAIHRVGHCHGAPNRSAPARAVCPNVFSSSIAWHSGPCWRASISVGA